jgi:hypothetical protein
MARIIATGFATQGFDPFFRNNRNHYPVGQRAVSSVLEVKSEEQKSHINDLTLHFSLVALHCGSVSCKRFRASTCATRLAGIVSSRVRMYRHSARASA